MTVDDSEEDEEVRRPYVHLLIAVVTIISGKVLVFMKAFRKET